MATQHHDPEQDHLPDERPQRRREYSGATSTLGLAAVVVLAVGFAIWWFELRQDSAAIDDGVYGIVDLADAQNPTSKKPAAEEGRAAPDFVLPGLMGGEVQLTAYRGKFVLLNFWASWCPPCRQETPDLQALAEDPAAGNLVIIGVNQQEADDVAADFIDDYGVTYPIAMDHAGEVSVAYRVSRDLPVSMLVDPSGVIAKIYIGQLTGDQIDAIRSEYLAP
ncbi:MAG: redoxin domain-containing protein [Hyphomicrobiales bacterium]